MSKGTTMSARPVGLGQSSKMGSEIPQSVRKTVQSMKEIVPNSEDEIFAALKECHMDPNEALEKLITQNPFEEVRQRRKNKKKETAGTQSPGDNRGRSVTNTGPRGGRSGPLDRGAGRGGPQKFGTSDLSGGRNKPLPPRENGIHPSSRPQVNNTLQQLSPPPFVQPKAYIPAQSSLPATANVPPPSLPNGNAVYTQASRPQGSWGTGGGISMADIVKSNGTTSSTGPSPSPVVQQPAQPPPVSVPSQFLPTAAPSSSAPPSTGVYSSASDPVLHHPLEPRGHSGVPMKRDVGTVGGQRMVGERLASSSSGAPSSGPSASSPAPIGPPALTPKPSTPVSSGIMDGTVVQASPSSSAGPPALQQERPSSADSGSLGSHSHSTQPRTSAPSPTRGAVGSQINGRPSTYQPQAVAPKVTPASSGLEWKTKPASVASTVGSVPSSGTVAESSGVSSTSGKLQALGLQDDKPVMIPSHLQVSEAERTHLSFGSFDAGFGTSFGSGFANVDESEISANKPEASTSDSPPPEAPTSSNRQTMGNSASASSGQVYSHPPTSTVMSTISSSTVEAGTSPVPVALQSEPSKPDSLMQQGPPYPYVPTMQNYPFGLVPQMPGGQYGAYEPSDAQQDVSRLPGLGMQPYSDPTGSYYSPGFRPQSETEARYSSPLVGSTASGSGKYGSNSVAGMSSQQASMNESGTSALSSSPASSQGVHASSQSSATGQSIPAIPQQPLPLHAGYAAQPAGIPLAPHYAGMYGGFAQYMAPNAAYAYHMHSPYSHPTYGVSPGNSAYPQAPAGTTYPPAAGNNYPPTGAANVKYPSVLPQYKPSSATAGQPHSGAAAGYASYGGAPSGYAAAPAVSTGSASGYEDVSGSQYKDNLYIANQQMSRDMAAGMPTSSYYNIPGQGQHTAYGHTGHTQQPTHAHAAAYAAGMYHPSQAGPAPTGHQMLQQPQPMGGSGGGGAQGGGYQQQQRAQQSWNNGY